MENRYRNISVRKLVSNEGQLEGLPANPRWIDDKAFKALKKSIKDAPEFLEARMLLVYPLEDGTFIVIGGNMRLEACKQLGYRELPCYVFPKETTVEKLKEYVIKDNVEKGSWDYEALANEWNVTDLGDWGMELDRITPPEVDADFGAADSGFDAGDGIDGEGEEDEDEDEGDDEDVSFYQQMLGDKLYDSDNDFDIPSLLMDRQPGYGVDLPFSAWGADSRLRTDIATYHFYVDDYRFEAIWKDPVRVLASGCKAVVEPNLSVFDTTPIAYGLQQIYKKRYIARYFQECGVKVYADLNVAVKFQKYNMMGIPKGYNAFATRGYSDRIEYLKSELAIAREISGLEKPNMIVYGGGTEIKKFCKDNGILYLEQFMANASERTGRGKAEASEEDARNT